MTELVSQNTPPNQNQLQGNHFQLTFKRIPSMVFFCQKAPLPGFTVPTAIQATPFVNLPVPGHKLIYDPFVVDFMVDEDMRSWTEIYNWIYGISFPEGSPEYANMISQYGSPYSEAVLSILTNQNNPNLRAIFHDAFPTGLSKLNFDVKITPETPVVAQAVFAFKWYDIQRTNTF